MTKERKDGTTDAVFVSTERDEGGRKGAGHLPARASIAASRRGAGT